MATLPTPGGDEGTWGDELNEFLRVAHEEDGTINAENIAVADTNDNFTGTDVEAVLEEIRVQRYLDIPDGRPLVAHAMDDEFDAGSLDGKWSWTNQGGATVTFPYKRGLSLNIPSNGGQSARILEQTISGTFDVRVRFQSLVRPGSANFKLFGLIARNSSSGKCLSAECFDSSGSREFGLRPMASPTSFSSIINSINLGLAAPIQWLRMANDGTNVTMYVSYDGLGWWSFGSTQTLAAHIGSIDRIGVYGDDESSTAYSILFHYFRRAA